MKRIRTNLAIAAVVTLVATACGDASGASDETTAPGEAVTSSTQVVETTTVSEAADETTTTTQEKTSTTTAAQDESDDSVRTVDIVMTDFAFEPEHLEVSAGETVKFVVVNEGAVDHEFRLSNSHRIEEHLASDHDDHEEGEEEGGHHEEDGDVFVVLEPGQIDELTVTFPEDATVYTETACLLPGHYEAGMKGTISYTGG